MQSWVSLSRTEHLQKKWRKRNGFGFAASLQVTPILIGELNQLIPHYCIAFIEENGNLQPIVLLGLGGERNLYVNDANQWMADYVPAALRAFPFQFGSTADESIVLCIEESHISDAPTDGRLFKEDGELSEEVEVVYDFMKNCSINTNLTMIAARAIKDANVVEPWNLRIQKAGEDDTHEIKGLYKVNENLLNNLSNEAYLNLRQSGALLLVFAHLFSLHQIKALANRAEFLNRQSAPSFSDDMRNIFEESGTINFDALTGSD